MAVLSLADGRHFVTRAVFHLAVRDPFPMRSGLGGGTEKSPGWVESGHGDATDLADMGEKLRDGGRRSSHRGLLRVHDARLACGASGGFGFELPTQEPGQALLGAPHFFRSDCTQRFVSIEGVLTHGPRACQKSPEYEHGKDDQQTHRASYNPGHFKHLLGKAFRGGSGPSPWP